MDSKVPNQSQVNSGTENIQTSIQQNANSSSPSVTQEDLRNTQNFQASDQINETRKKPKKRITKSKTIYILFLLFCIFIPPFQIFLIFFPLWIINELIVNRSWYTKSKFDTLFKSIIFLMFIGTHFLIIFLLATDPCELKGTCVETFMAGGPLLFITLVVGAILLTFILPLIIILPAKLESTKLKTLLKSPRYIAFIILIIIMGYGNISIAYGFRQGNEEAIAKYQKEQAESIERARIREVERAKEEKQKRIEEENYRIAHPEEVRNDQRIKDQEVISDEIIEFESKKRRLPLDLAELKTSGYDVPTDPLTGSFYKYFKNDTLGNFAVCVPIEHNNSIYQDCDHNGKQRTVRGDVADSIIQGYVDKDFVEYEIKNGTQE